MTILEREKIDKKYKRRSTFYKWIRKYINYDLGMMLVLRNWDNWDNTYKF